jgi:hypothetical protein
VQSLRYGQDRFYTFSFSPVTPETFSAAGRSVALDADFRENMRFSPEYPPQTGPNGFVVLLHDPHQHIAGRYQTLAALRALSLTNPGLKFSFLVEGLYQQEGRRDAWRVRLQLTLALSDQHPHGIPATLRPRDARACNR